MPVLKTVGKIILASYAIVFALVFGLIVMINMFYYSLK